MTKITLQDLTSLTNEQSAINLINSNNAVIENKSDTFLSRDGSSPNQMLADLDMNSKRILNLPAPVDDTEPLRKKDVPSGQQIGDITGAVEDAQQAAAVATAAAVSASNSATSALEAADDLKGTSNTSNVISLGSKTFTTQSGKFFDEGIWLLITSDANEANYMHGRSTGYAGTTLNFLVTNIGGAGSFSDWTIRLSGTQGAKGDQGLTGPPGATGGSFFPVARVVATTHVDTLTALESGDIIDGVILTTGDVVLLTNQNTPSQNGLYTTVAAGAGAASRTPNYTVYSSIAGSYIAIMEGNTYSDTLWFCSSNPGGTINSTPLVFQQYALGKNYTIAEKNQMTTNIGFTQSTVDAIASTTLDLETSIDGWTVNVTANANPTTTSIILSPGRTRTVRFINPLTLQNGPNLVLPGSANISVLAGDVAVFQGTLGGIVRCMYYARADGSPLKGVSLDSVDGTANVKGSILYRDTSAWASLPPTGSVQRALVTTGVGTNPTWGQINLGQATGTVAIANLPNGGTATSSTFLRGDGSWVAPSGAGDVAGPSTSTIDNIVTFASATGKTIKDAGISLSSVTGMGRIPLSGFSFSDANNNEMLRLQGSVGSVNEITIASATAGNRPIVGVSGNDANIELILTGKGNKGVLIQGDTSGGAAPAGYYGEIISLTSGGVVLPNDTGTNLITHTLTPGDWHVCGAVAYAGAGTSSYILAAIHGSSGAVNSATYGYNFYTGFYSSFSYSTFVGTQAPTIQLVGGRISVATNTPIYLNAQSSSTGGCTGVGHLEIRRIR